MSVHTLPVQYAYLNLYCITSSDPYQKCPLERPAKNERRKDLITSVNNVESRVQLKSYELSKDLHNTFESSSIIKYSKVK